jgi:hypothetical protein
MAVAVEASETAINAAHKTRHASSRDAASAARKQAERAADEAEAAAVAAKGLQALAESHATKAKALGQGFTETESKTLELVHHAGLLLESTPRDLKRMMNRYQLAKYICMEQVCDDRL